MEYYSSSQLVDYLPASLKDKYKEALKMIRCRFGSKEAPLALRKLIESFLLERGIPIKEHNMREAISSLHDVDLEKKLHKMLDDDIMLLDGQLKTEDAPNHPKEDLKLLEILFTKIYKIPVEEEKLQKELEVRKTLIECSYQELLKHYDEKHNKSDKSPSQEQRRYESMYKAPSRQKTS